MSFYLAMLFSMFGFFMGKFSEHDDGYRALLRLALAALIASLLWPLTLGLFFVYQRHPVTVGRFIRDILYTLRGVK